VAHSAERFVVEAVRQGERHLGPSTGLGQLAHIPVLGAQPAGGDSSTARVTQLPRDPLGLAHVSQEPLAGARLTEDQDRRNATRARLTPEQLVHLRADRGDPGAPAA
jgi:hypothetical protein